MPNIQIVRENSLGLNRGIYATWIGNQLSDANANTLLNEKSAVLVLESPRLQGSTIQVTTSRALTQADNGLTLDCTTSGLTLTMPAGLVNFGCAIINNTTTIAFSGDATGNGATDDIALTAAVGAIVPTSTANAYKVVG